MSDIVHLRTRFIEGHSGVTLILHLRTHFMETELLPTGKFFHPLELRINSPMYLAVSVFHSVFEERRLPQEQHMSTAVCPTV